MYFSGKAAFTVGEMRLAENRGPLVEEDMCGLPVVAAGDCHIAWATGSVLDTGWRKCQLDVSTCTYAALDGLPIDFEGCLVLRRLWGTG